MNPDAHGWYRVHAVDGSGLDYSTNSYDPEIHVLVDAPASDAHGRPNAATVAEAVEEPTPESSSVIPGPSDQPKVKATNKAEEAKQ